MNLPVWQIYVATKTARYPIWTTPSRAKYNCDTLQYPSDLTDAELAPVEPLIPMTIHRRAEVGKVVNAIMFVLSTRCQWRYIPKALTRRSTLHDYLVRWNDDITLTAIHHVFYVRCRDLIHPGPRTDGLCGRAAMSIRTAMTREIKGKNRHILVDTVEAIRN